MKVWTALLVVIVLTLTICMPVAAEGVIEIKAPSALLIEKTTGAVLYEKNADQRLRPASVTKIMTLLLIMEAIESGQYKTTDVVTASANAAAMGGSQVYLKENEKLTVDEMIKCIAVASANDCCVAMAEFTASSEQAFVKMMNEKAKSLSMDSTEFKNCTGLDENGHLTTARDISIMSRELLKHQRIKEYTMIWTDSIRNGTFGLSNTNKLIRFYDSATGLKTGYTSESGYCISATAMQDGMELIAVVMAAESSDSRNADAKALLQYGFANYELFTAKFKKSDSVKILKGKQKKLYPAVTGQFSTVVKKGASQGISYRTELCDDVEAPVMKGQKLGEIQIYNQDEIIGKTDIISQKYYPRAGIKDIFFKILHYFLMV